MLPRVLEQLSKREAPSEQAMAIETLIESVGVCNDNDEEQGDQDWQSLLEELKPSKEMSFAEVNAKRKQLTFRAFSDPKVPGRILILETMVAPNLQLMDKLFKRSGWISSMYHLPNSEKARRDEISERQGEWMSSG